MSKTEISFPEEMTLARDLDNCVCFSNAGSIYPELLSPKENDLKRLVLYIYKDINTNELKFYIPDPEQQSIIPNIPISASNEVKTLTSETIMSHINQAFNNISINEEGLDKSVENEALDNIFINEEGLDKTIENEALNNIFINEEGLDDTVENEALDNIFINEEGLDDTVENEALDNTFINEEGLDDTVENEALDNTFINEEGLDDSVENEALDNTFINEEGLDNTVENYIEFKPDAVHIFNNDNKDQISQVMNQDNNIYEENTSYVNSLYNTLYTLAYLYQSNKFNSYQKEKIIEIFNQLKDEFNKKKSEFGIKNTLTFDQWFNQQMKIFREEVTQGKLNTDILKTLIQQALIENRFHIDSSGLITDENGVSISFNNLELRSVLIGKPVTYQQVIQGDLTLDDNVPYLEGILITLLDPPEILGVISLRNEHYSVSSDNTISSSTSDFNLDIPYHEPYTENKLSHHISSTTSDSKLNLDMNSGLALNSEPSDALSNSIQTSEDYDVSSPQYNHWLHTLLHAIINSNYEKIQNASKDIQKPLMTESNNKIQQTIDDTTIDNDYWKHIYLPDEHSWRMNNEIRPFQKPKNQNLPVIVPIRNSPRNMYWPNYLSNYESSDSMARPIAVPFETKLNTLPSKTDRYPTQYYLFDRKPFANAIPYTRNEDSLSSNPDNLKISYPDLKGHSDNFDANLMTIPYKNSPLQFYPNFITSYPDPKHIPSYRADWISRANAIDPVLTTPYINYRHPITHSIGEFLSGPNVEKVSNPVRSYPTNLGSPPDIVKDHGADLKFQYVKEESIHPGSHPYIKPMYNNRNIPSLLNWNTKQMANPETNQFENFMDINKLRSLRTQIPEPTGLDDNNLIFRPSRRQGFSQLPASGLSNVFKSVINSFTSLVKNGDDNQKSESQEGVEVFTKKPSVTKDDERPDYRIIGGSAAMGSGSPLSYKGRSGYI